MHPPCLSQILLSVADAIRRHKSFDDLPVFNDQRPIPYFREILIMGHNNQRNSMFISEFQKYFHNFLTRI